MNDNKALYICLLVAFYMVMSTIKGCAVDTASHQRARWEHMTSHGLHEELIEVDNDSRFETVWVKDSDK